MKRKRRKPEHCEQCHADFLLSNWRAVGAIIRRELPEDIDLVLASLLMQVGFFPPDVSTADAVANCRELFEFGYLDIADDGMAFPSAPVIDDDGDMTRRPITVDEMHEIAGEGYEQ